MLTIWLTLSFAAATPVHNRGVDAIESPVEKPASGRPAPAPVPPTFGLRPPTIEEEAGLRFFDADAFHRSRHYVVFDQRGAAEAERTASFLEEAFDAFQRTLRAAPEIEDGEQLRVEVYRDSAQWRERLTSLGLRTGLPEDPSRYDARSRSVLVLVGETAYETRAWLLGATMRQFHHHAKRKNAALVDNWFVVGLSEMAAMHRWDGDDIEISARLLVSKVDTPALALEAMRHRPANLPQFTPEVLEGRPMAWTLTCFLMEGEKGKHKKRFQKLALGHRGSMLDGARLAQSLGPADEILPAVQSWLSSRQQPLEVLAGDFEDLGRGHIIGTGTKACSIAATREPVTRLRCVLEVDPSDAAGLLVGYRNARRFTYLLFERGQLYVGRVRPSSHDLELFRPQPRSTSGRLKLGVSGSDGLVEVRVAGEDVGRLAVPDQRLGLVATRGSSTFSGLDWE